MYVKHNFKFLIFYDKHVFTHYDFPREIRTYLLSNIFDYYTCV